MGLDELESWLWRELEAAGFRAEAPSPALAWAVFKRSLALPLSGEAVPFARCALFRDLHRLTFGRRLRLAADGRAWALEFRFTRQVAGAPDDAGSFRREADDAPGPAEEILAAAEASPAFRGALGCAGPWHCVLAREDYGPELVAP